MEEIWKDVVGYEGLYVVSNLGIVKSVKRTVRKLNRYKTYTNQPIPEKIKQGSPDKDGYLKISLWKDNKCNTTSIHRTVANAFLPNPYNLPQVNHIDEDKTNNAVSNLHWCTELENIRHGTGMLRSQLSNIKPILQYDLNGNFIKEWKNYYAVAEYYKVSFKAISQAVRKQITSAGFQWRKKNTGQEIKPISPYKNKRFTEIHQFSKAGILIKSYKSILDASLNTGIDRSAISHNASGNKKSAGGYVWAYSKENSHSLERLTN